MGALVYPAILFKRSIDIVTESGCSAHLGSPPPARGSRITSYRDLWEVES